MGKVNNYFSFVWFYFDFDGFSVDFFSLGYEPSAKQKSKNISHP